MNAVAFDTHNFVKRLTKAGMPAQQAEALAEEQARLLEGQLATKRDLAETKAEILKWMFGQTVVIIALIKLF